MPAPVPEPALAAVRDQERHARDYHGEKLFTLPPYSPLRFLIFPVLCFLSIRFCCVVFPGNTLRMFWKDREHLKQAFKLWEHDNDSNITQLFKDNYSIIVIFPYFIPASSSPLPGSQWGIVVGIYDDLLGLLGPKRGAFFSAVRLRGKTQGNYTVTPVTGGR